MQVKELELYSGGRTQLQSVSLSKRRLSCSAIRGKLTYLEEGKFFSKETLMQEDQGLLRLARKLADRLRVNILDEESEKTCYDECSSPKFVQIVYRE